MKRAKHQTAKKPELSNSRRRGWRIVGALVVVGLLVFGVWCLVFWDASPKPPQVPLAALDPSLIQHIKAVRTNVLAARKSAEAWGKYGEALHAGEFHQEASFCYSNAAALNPKAFRWPYLLGLLQMQDQPGVAIQNLERATQLAGAETDGPRYQLSRALVERGRYDEARPHLQLILAANPNHAAARMEMARIYIARRTFKEATQELQPALTNQYTMRGALLLAAQMAQRNGQADTATLLSQHAASIAPTFGWPDPVLREVQYQRVDRAKLADQANALLQQKRLPDAEATLAKLLNVFPDDAEGLLLLGRLRYLQNRCAEAETALRRLLTVQTNSLNGLIQLGLSLLCQEQWSNAVPVLEEAVALKPDFAQAHSNLGVARSRLGDSAGAIRAYRETLRCSPGDVNAHFALAEELANAGQVEEAKEHVRRAAAISPNDRRLPAAREQLGMREK